MFLDQESGDQEPGQHEEDVDTDVAATERRTVEKRMMVKQHHHGDGEGAHTVQRRLISERLRRGARDIRHAFSPGSGRTTLSRLRRVDSPAE